MKALTEREATWARNTRDHLFARTIPFASAFPETGAGRLLH
jgi:hypothetical protein